MILKCIHPDAKAGRDVRVPGFHDAPIKFGEEVDWPPDMWRKALESGNWERLPADVKAGISAEDKAEAKPEVKVEIKREVQAEVFLAKKESN